MKKRNVMGAAILLAALLTGCKSQEKTKTSVLEIYDAAANFQGMQSGWFGKVLKDKCNVEINIIAPNIAGDPNSLYQTRSASGNLGDIVILDNSQFQECVKAGLITDISQEIGSYKNLMQYKDQISAYNKMIGGKTESIYGIPCQMNTNGPTAYMEDTVYSCPRLPWDYFTELGRPQLNTLDDLLSVLVRMQKNSSGAQAGGKTYAVSLWKDWDNPNNNCGIEVVNQMTKWYGQEVNGAIMIGTDGSIKPVTDKNGAYYKMLRFLYNMNQAGLVDPDSGTQQWNNVMEKIKSKRVLMLWYNWQRGFYNTPERANKNDAYVCIPVKDMSIYQASDSYYGDGRVWGIGSKVSKEKRAEILKFLDWYASPEGAQYEHDGLKDVIYTVLDNGAIELTTDGYAKDTRDVQIPEEFGGGTYKDGNNQINQWITSSVSVNPATGECYEVNLLTATKKANETKMTKEWTQFYNAANEVEYYRKNGQLDIVPSENLLFAPDSTDMSMIRSQCGESICDTSWKLIYAKNDEDFDMMWNAMLNDLNGLGWDKLVKFDTGKFQAVVDARASVKK